MDIDNLKIGIALSGGGIRATVFHLGIFKYLAEQGLMSHVASISSVSGASLCVGLIVAKNGLKWPSDKEYLEKVLPQIEETVLGNDIQRDTLWRLPFSPAYWWNRVELVAKTIEKSWGVNGTLQDLPDYPHWEINCTTFETGKNFRLRKDYMGDYVVGYVQKPALQISEVIAASAGFPILIGPYKIKTDKYQWTRNKMGGGHKEPAESVYTLWDGGVYDNLGLEALYKVEKGLDSEINFLIACNASCSIGYKSRKGNMSVSNIMRLLDITMDQVLALRSRDIRSSVVSKGKGLYIEIEKSAFQIFGKKRAESEEIKALIASCLTPEEVQKVSKYATTLSTPTVENYRLILQHGYENAKCTFMRYEPIVR